jgi:hypothetical protein
MSSQMDYYPYDSVSNVLSNFFRIFIANNFRKPCREIFPFLNYNYNFN